MPRFALHFNAAFLLGGLMLLLGSGKAQAHAIPSLTVEAIFSTDRSYVLRVNVDPRLFLSDKPTALPPVEAGWYRDQTPEQLKATEKKSSEYLASALRPLFSGQVIALPDTTYEPMDGATNLPLTPESKEVHLLAQMHGQVPAGALDFALGVGREANTSLILINSLDGKEERRPQVLFPGETSRAFALPGSADAGKTSPGAPKTVEPLVTTVEVQEVSRAGPLIVVLGGGLIIAVAFIVMRMLRK
ncbi:MAG: hypothetical protein JWO94_1986 [Verrucomicrobiaceae bacterium]|nr:hypothetical protein [Verrucomicrobiaceae bacterium]